MICFRCCNRYLSDFFYNHSSICLFIIQNDFIRCNQSISCLTVYKIYLSLYVFNNNYTVKTTRKYFRKSEAAKEGLVFYKCFVKAGKYIRF